MPGDIYDEHKVVNDLADILEESELAKGRDALMRSGFSDGEIRAMEIMIATSSDPGLTQRMIGQYYVDKQQQADLQQFIKELPEAGKQIEAERLAAQFGLPVDHVRECIAEADRHDALLASLNGVGGEIR